MKWFEFIKFWKRRKSQAVYDRALNPNPLREFIYLDEVSLRSLLSSKKGEMTSTTSTESTQSVEKETQRSIGLNVETVGKMESAARFQTRNSSTLQTAKKATVQSWFRELDRLRDIRLIETVQHVIPFEQKSDISETSHRSVCIDEKHLKRGEIIEFKVQLSTDPIFHMVTLFSEMMAMVEDFPQMMDDHGGANQLREFSGLSRVLNRLLVGLIPIRAKVINYGVIAHEGKKYVVHMDAIANLDIEYEPLEIVCVTELDAYWKDIRRVLFSDGEFTMMARLSKTGIQNDWTPIKLTDLLAGLVPDLTEHLNNATSIAFNQQPSPSAVLDNAAKLRSTLVEYSQKLLNKANTTVTDDIKHLVCAQIVDLEISEQTATSQKDAFVLVRKIVEDYVKIEITPEEDLNFREEVRKISGLNFFGNSKTAEQPALVPKSVNTVPANLLDVEVIAMYW